jgi:hypothetical protein
MLVWEFFLFIFDGSQKVYFLLMYFSSRSKIFLVLLFKVLRISRLKGDVT